MKNLLKYSFAAMAGLMLASCAGDYDDWALPQNNKAEEVAAKYGITFAEGDDANVVLPVREDNLKLMAITASSPEVVDYAITSLTVNGEPIEGTVERGNIVVATADLLALVEKQFNSRAAIKRDLTVDAVVTLILANGDAVTTDVTGTVAASLTPKPVPAIDPLGYYMLGGFEENAIDGNGWQPTKPVWMTSNGDGTYTATVTCLTENDNWFKFYCGSNFVSGDWDAINQGEMGCAENGDPSLEGFIIYKGDDKGVQTPVIHGDGTYKVTIDMNNLTYSVVRTAVNYYIVGGPNSDWAGSAAAKQLQFQLVDLKSATYTITFPAAEGDTWFAFGDEKACDAIANNEEGAWDLLFATTKGNGNNGTEGSLARRKDLEDRNVQGDGSFKVEAGHKFIKMNIDMKNMTYTIQSLDFETYIYEAGVNNNWGEKQQPLYSADGMGQYTGYFYAKEDSWTDGRGAFKFRGAADNWDNGNWGVGTFSDEGGTLTDNGDNIFVTPGFYRADVNLADMTYKLTRINVVDVIGDACENGWDSGIDMTYNPDELCWQLETTLKPGNLKFRGNNNWGNDDGNWGGTMDNIINGSNDNIQVDVTGKVLIKFYPLCDTRSYCTITPAN